MSVPTSINAAPPTTTTPTIVPHKRAPQGRGMLSEETIADLAAHRQKLFAAMEQARADVIYWQRQQEMALKECAALGMDVDEVVEDAYQQGLSPSRGMEARDMSSVAGPSRLPEPSNAIASACCRKECSCSADAHRAINMNAQWRRLTEEDAKFADDGNLVRTPRSPGPDDMLSYHDVNQYIQRCANLVGHLNKDTPSRAVHETYMKLMSMGYPSAAPEKETDEQQMPTSGTEDDADYRLALKLQREELEQRHGGRNIGHGDVLCHPVLRRWATDEEDLQMTSEGGASAGEGEDYVGKGKGKAVDKGKGKAVEKGKGKAVYVGLSKS